MQRKYFRIKEVCQMTGLSRTTVYRMIKKGILKAHNPMGTVLIEAESLENLKCEEVK